MIVYSEYCESYSLFILFNLNFVQQMSRVQLSLHINIYKVYHIYSVSCKL